MMLTVILIMFDYMMHFGQLLILLLVVGALTAPFVWGAYFMEDVSNVTVGDTIEDMEGNQYVVFDTRPGIIRAKDVFNCIVEIPESKFWDLFAVVK